MMGNYNIRIAERNEVDIAVEWAAREGWNPGLHDAECYYNADPSGFLIGLLDDKPIAFISAVKYGESFGFIGFYVVAPEYRGNGYGLKIWNAAIESLAGRNIALDGVVAQQRNYSKSNFILAYRNIRYEGNVSGSQVDNSAIINLADLPFQTIAGYDRPFFPDNRERFIHSWITQPGAAALGIMKNNKLAGYGVRRKCRTGYKIGPLFADDKNSAGTLFNALCFGIDKNEPVYLDVPEVNYAAVQLAEEHGMELVFETARMYTKQIPGIEINRTFGVTSFEIG